MNKTECFLNLLNTTFDDKKVKEEKINECVWQKWWEIVSKIEEGSNKKWLFSYLNEGDFNDSLYGDFRMLFLDHCDKKIWDEKLK